MIETRPATESESQSWFNDWRARLEAWYGRLGGPADWASGQVDRQIAMFRSAPESALSALTEDGQLIGVLAVATARQDGTQVAFISDVWIAPEHRRKGHGARALRLAEQWARAREASTIWLRTDPGEPAHAALFAGYPVRARQMIKALSGPGELADGLEGRPMTEADFADWRAESLRGYTADIADSGTMPADQAAISAAAQFDQLLPDGLNTANHTFLSLWADGEVVATNWISHHRNPGVSWVYGVETHEGHRGKGYGRAAMVIGERATLQAGDTHLALNVFGHNDVAIGMYQAMGYLAYDHGRSRDL